MRGSAARRLYTGRVSYNLYVFDWGRCRLELTEEDDADENLAVSRGAVDFDCAKVADDVGHLSAEPKHFHGPHGPNHDSGDAQSPFDVFNPHSLSGLGPGRKLECGQREYYKAIC